MKTFVVLVSLAFAASAEIVGKQDTRSSGAGENEYGVRYIVFPGLDATPGEIAEWGTGWAAPFNVFFGPKPYVIGWIGEAGPFGPPNPDDGIDYRDEKDEDDGGYQNPENLLVKKTG